jgi:ABC-type Na+ efflux pump permease subunit
MVPLPVVERELRVAARARATYRVRFYAVLVMLGILFWCLNASGLDQNNPQFGWEIMEYLVLPAFGFSLFIGVIVTADCVSAEKREGTLGLLFLTDLKGYDVICGKLAANSLNAIYGLLAILPILGLPVLLGGVTFAQFVKLAIALLSTMILSLSVGIFVSTDSRDGRKAMFFTVLIILAATVLPIWYGAAAGLLPTTGIWKPFLFSPGYAIIQIMNSTTPSASFPECSYWLCILWQWLLAAALIAWASGHVPHSWEESLKKPRVQILQTNARVKSRSQQGRALLERNPFLWLALQGEEASSRNVWLFVFAIFTIWAIAALRHGIGVAVYEDTVTATISVLHLPLKIWIAAEASRCFSEDRSNLTFETLLSTPLSARQIIQGQALALLRQFGGPIALVLVWETFMEIHRVNEHVYNFWRPYNATMSYWPGMFLLVADAAALAWAGMWLGLKCKGRIRAILGSLALVLFVPWLISQIIMTMPPLVVSRTQPGYAWNSTGLSVQVMAVLIPELLLDLLIMGWAVTRLPQNFRQLALRP